MQIQILSPMDPLWNELMDYAENCSWRAGKRLAQEMRAGNFTGWERVLAAVEESRIAGYCTVARTDCIPDLPYTPFIGYLFVGEAHRGARLSQRLIQKAMDYLGDLGFDRVYLVSDHENLYEKYGFRAIDARMAPWGAWQKIYVRSLEPKEGGQQP